MRLDWIGACAGTWLVTDWFGVRQWRGGREYIGWMGLGCLVQVNVSGCCSTCCCCCWDIYLYLHLRAFSACDVEFYEYIKGCYDGCFRASGFSSDVDGDGNCGYGK